MDDDSEFVPLKINPVIAESKPMECLARAFEMAELVEIALEHFTGKAAKLAEDVELQFARHLRQFAGAGRIKNDLELHGSSLLGGFRFSTLNPLRKTESASWCRRA